MRKEDHTENKNNEVGQQWTNTKYRTVFGPRNIGKNTSVIPVIQL